MRVPALRRALQTIVLAGLPACGIDDLVDESDMCTRTQTKVFEVATAAADPPLQLRIESCRVDADACMELCSMLMSRAGLPPPRTCDVMFDASDVVARTSWNESTGAAGCPVEGRRPAGLVDPRRIDAADAAGAWLARAAWLEAASVPAFIYLARELDSHGAPRVLVRAALAAACDEIRHARVMKAIAERYGARVPGVDVAPPTVRPLEELARENAIEGCVRETWGAVVALWQAHRAGDAPLRRVFRAIAADEARHAALGWQIDRWVRTRLPADAHARIDAARDAAVRELFAGHDPDALAVLGLPAGDDARGLLSRTYESLWARRAA